MGIPILPTWLWDCAITGGLYGLANFLWTFARVMRRGFVADRDKS